MNFMHHRITGVRTLAALLLILSAASVPAAAGAQTLDSPYRFIPERQYGGLLAAWLSPSEGRLGMGPEAGPAFGARWGIEIAGPLGLDIEAMYAPLTRAVVDTAFTADSSRVVKGEAN